MRRQSTDNKGSIGAKQMRDSSSFPSDATQGAYFLFVCLRLGFKKVIKVTGVFRFFYMISLCALFCAKTMSG